MKTSALVATAAGALIGLTATAQGPVYSVNIVGFQKVSTGAGRLELASNPFVASNTSIQSVVSSSSFNGGLAPDDADNLYFYDTAANGYKRYFLYVDGTNTGDDNKWLDENYVPSAEAVTPGKGFFIQNLVGTATNTVTLVGDVVMAPTVASTISPGLNQISYPYSTTADLNTLKLKQADGAIGALAPDDADNIFVWSQSGNGYTKYFLYVDGTATGDDNKWLDENYIPAAVTIQPGQAFFYARKTGSPNLTWTETKPY